MIFAGVVAWDALEYPRPGSIHQDYHPSEYAKRAEERIAVICRDLVGVQQAACAAEIADRQREKHDSERDLNAQRYMAFWAFWMVVASTIAAFATLVGLILLQRTWRETKRTADVAQSAFLMSERPHLFIGEVQPMAPLFSDYPNRVINPDLEFFDVRYDVQNHGKTPAIIKALEASVRILPNLDGTPEFSSGEQSPFEMIVAAERARTASQFMRRAITEEDAHLISRSRQVYIEGAAVGHIFFYVRVTYTSPLGVTDQIMSAFRYDPITNDFIPASGSNFNYRRLGQIEPQS
ncbi:hypothetical protein [Ovoidimarina sediminis]|uniref:hypothetical protein n=1 Tax=Ovoidimarina sediminis TaxID=3079856 RepID=UPI0029151531|nr:hypothetical protein [Rhodophyticola sp. MJ-SS7]MDU8945580.1 hypothetical protein [Rhodophyticola sp. MJ-SS7]